MADELRAFDPSTTYLPPLWQIWEEAVERGCAPSELGLQCDQASLNRFRTRYRIARAFRGVVLDGFGQETVAGYSALVRLLFSWSAFEQYLRAVGYKQSQCATWLSQYVPRSAVRQIRLKDERSRLFHLVISKVTHAETERQLRLYLDGRPFNFSYLASSMRHIFAHGMLTPHANRAAPDAVTDIAELLASIHLDAVATDFRIRVEGYAARKSRAEP